MPVIGGKLFFCLQEFLLIENAPHLYATFQVMSEMHFKNKTFQDYQDIKQKLKYFSNADEYKDFDKCIEESLDKIPMQYLTMHLENSIKNDFLAPDEECAFLGKHFSSLKLNCSHAVKVCFCFYALIQDNVSMIEAPLYGIYSVDFTFLIKFILL